MKNGAAVGAGSLEQQPETTMDDTSASIILTTCFAAFAVLIVGIVLFGDKFDAAVDAVFRFIFRTGK